MRKDIAIEIFNNSAFLSNQNFYIVRSKYESIETWINRFLDDLIIKNSDNVYFDIAYPVNPIIENINLTKSISMQAITKIAEIGNLNIVIQSTFDQIKKHYYQIDAIYVVGGLEGDLNFESEKLSSNLNLPSSKKIKFLFSGNEALKNNILWPTKPTPITLNLENFINGRVFKRDLVNSILIISKSLEFIYYDKFLSLLKSNNKLKSKKLIINYKKKNEILVKLSNNETLILHVMNNGAKILKKKHPYNETIFAYPFLGMNVRNKFIFIWIIQYFDKLNLFKVISKNPPEITFINILEEKIDEELLFWLNISFMLSYNKSFLSNIRIIKNDKKKFSENVIFKDLLNYFTRLEKK